MALDKYIVSRSNYTIKKKHKTVSNGTIYERDFMTTTQNGSFDGDVFPYSEGNFKMVRRFTNNRMRKHKFGDWFKQDVCVNGNNNGEYWTLNCISNDKTESAKSIEIKPNFNSMLDFAYYGSCAELVKTSVNNIVSNYPAELYFTNNLVHYYDGNTTRELGYNLKNDLNYVHLSYIFGRVNGNRLYEISNPYDIDITRKYVNREKNPNINYLRYFCLSANKYDILNKNNTMMACACDWDVVYKTKGCIDGQLTGVIIINKNFNYPGTKSGYFYIFEYYVKGKYYLMSDNAYIGIKIRPSQAIIKDYFDNIDDFEKLLLNRKSVPLYTCRIDSPRETEQGIESYKKDFTWPTLYGWNLDIDSDSYSRYINGLLDVAEFYDEHKTDNLWSIMSHDAIRNMDLTYIRNDSNETSDDYRIGTAKIESLIHAYGRQFDSIKRSIDNIKSVNVITYNQNNNTPDYFLSDSLELSGWEVYSSVNGLTTDTNFYAINKGDVKTRKYGVNETDIEFMRNLKLNSRAIISRKGTRTGIEYLLSLFGMQSYDFAKDYYESVSKEKKLDILRRNNKNATENDITEKFDSLIKSNVVSFYDLYDYRLDEYAYVASGGGEYKFVTSADTSLLDVEKYNSMKENFVEDGDSLQGLPCRMYTIDYRKNDSDAPNIFTYIVPWFDKLSEYDGNPYFQMYGGWGKMYKKEINNSNLTPLNEIFSTSDEYINVSGFTQFSLSDFDDGKYASDTAVGDYYPYNKESGDTTGWKSIIIENLNSGDTINIDTLQENSGITTDMECVIVSSEERVLRLYDGVFSSVTISEDNSTMVLMERNYDDIYVNHTHNYLKKINGVRFYDETCKYIRVVRNLDELKNITLDNLSNGDIYYVYDISDYDESLDLSHYFIINDVDYSNEISEDGWKNIPNSDISNGNRDGVKVLYLESILDDNKGNAPHTGNGHYDDGDEYLNYFRQLFYYSLKNYNFTDDAYDTCDTGEINPNIKNIGFNLVLQKDNMKCWYFKNTSSNNDIFKLTDNTENNSGDTFGSIVFNASPDEDLKVGKEANYKTTHGSDLMPYNFTPSPYDLSKNGESYDVAAADSIINIKKLRLQFNSKYALSDEFRKFIISSVMPYVKQIIPSTTILEISILGEESTFKKFEIPRVAGIAEDSYVLTKRYGKTK